MSQNTSCLNHFPTSYPQVAVNLPQHTHIQGCTNISHRTRIDVRVVACASRNTHMFMEKPPGRKPQKQGRGQLHATTQVNICWLHGSLDVFTPFLHLAPFRSTTHTHTWLCTIAYERHQRSLLQGPLFSYPQNPVPKCHVCDRADCGREGDGVQCTFGDGSTVHLSHSSGDL